MIDPDCKNHPGRRAVAHYGKAYAYSLCMECLNRRLSELRHIPLDEHGARCRELDMAAEAARDEAKGPS